MSDLPGRWKSPGVFEFDYPIEVEPGRVMRVLDLSQMELPDGVSLENVIEVMVSGARKAAEVVRLRLQCPACHRVTEVSPTQELIDELGIETVVELADSAERLPVLCPDCEKTHAVRA